MEITTRKIRTLRFTDELVFQLRPSEIRLFVLTLFGNMKENELRQRLSNTEYQAALDIHSKVWDALREEQPND